MTRPSLPCCPPPRRDAMELAHAKISQRVLFDCHIGGFARRCGQGRVGEYLSEVFFG